MALKKTHPCGLMIKHIYIHGGGGGVYKLWHLKKHIPVV